MDRAEQRDRMVDRLERTERVTDERVLAAMRSVPRHEFVPEAERTDAYRDTPLPIGEGQTISAPHMVATMASLLDLRPGHRVLEIGTGCGYHAAVTAELVGAENVYTVEYHESLAAAAADRLADLGYGGIAVRHGDGTDGWPAHAPYDRAYLTCAAPSFPDPVVEQVRPGGRLLAPIGEGRQRLVLAHRDESGRLSRDDHGAVRFVELL